MTNNQNYYDFINFHSRTGKTSRMIKNAEKLALCGEKVIIILHSMEMKNICKMLMSEENRHLLESGHIVFSTEEQTNIDWRNMSSIGISLDYHIMFDHFVLEKKFKHLFCHWLSNYQLN